MHGVRECVSGGGTVASAFLTDDEQESHPVLTRRPQTAGSCNLCCEDAFGVARTAPVEAAVANAAGEEWRDTIEMRR